MTQTANQSRTPILILGDAGPSRFALLARTDIELHWTKTLTGALAHLRQSKPKACIIHPSDCDGGLEQFVQACAREGEPPCIVVLRADEWDQQSQWISAGASEVVQIELTSVIMELLGGYTGLRFAKEERVAIELAVGISHEGKTLSLNTHDLSASGLAISGLSAEVGDLVQVELSLDGLSMGLWTRVVRVWQSAQGVAMAGLRFIGLGASQTDRIRGFVRTENAKHEPSEIHFENLFDGIKDAPAPQTLAPDDFDDGASQRDDQWLTEAAANLQALEAHASSTDATLAPFLVKVYSSLSELEIKALKSHGEPKWVYEIVHTLVSIESWRNQHPNVALPKPLHERANSQFLELSGHESEGEDMVIHVSLMRAHLLRYLFADSDFHR